MKISRYPSYKATGLLQVAHKKRQADLAQSICGFIPTSASEGQDSETQALISPIISQKNQNPTNQQTSSEQSTKQYKNIFKIGK